MQIQHLTRTESKEYNEHRGDDNIYDTDMVR
jgi:hypothetical protein